MGLGALIGISAGSAALSAGSSIAGNAMNKHSVDRTNETNMQIAQMNNEWSEKMMEKQMAYNTEMNQTQFNQAKELQDIQNDFQSEMWNKTNEYNSPENQRKRLEQAGLNPYIMMSGGSAGTATAMNGSSASAGGSSGVGLPSPSQVSTQAPRFDFSGIASSIMAGLKMFNDLKLGKEQADNLSIDKSIKTIEMQYKSRQIMQDLANRIAEQKNTEAKTKSLDALRELEKGQMVATIDNTVQQTMNLKETLKGVVLQNCMDYLQLKNMPTELALRNANIAASTAFMVAQKAMTEKQAINEIKKGLIMDYQGQKEKVSASYAEKMAKNLYLQAQSTLRRLLNNEGPESSWQESFKLGKYGEFMRGLRSASDIFKLSY